MEPVCDLQQAVVGECFSDQRDAKRQAVGLESGRDCHRCKIEQIHEVGVLAEIAVQLERRVLHLLDGVMRGRSGQQKKIPLFPD